MNRFCDYLQIKQQIYTFRAIAVIVSVFSMTFAGFFNFSSILPYVMMALILGLHEWGKNQIIIVTPKLKAIKCFFLLVYMLAVLNTGIEKGVSLNTFVFQGVFSLIGGSILFFIMYRALMRLRIESMKVSKICICIIVTILILMLFRSEALISDRIAFNKVLGVIVTGCVIFLSVFREYKQKIDRFFVFCAFFFAAIYVVGNVSIFENYKNINYFNIKIVFISIIFIFLYLIVFYITIKYIYFALLKIQKGYDYKQQNKNISIVFWFLIWIITVLWQLLYLGTYYPGILSPDSINQMGQVLGDVQYSNHHPWLHTLIIKFFFQIGFQLSDNYNVGILSYSIFSICFMCFCYVFCIYYLYTQGIKRKNLFFLWIIFAIDPIKSLFSITMWKDVIFSGVVLIFTVLLNILCDNTNKRDKKFFWFFFIITSFMMCLLRSNGYYAFLLLIPFLLIEFKKKWVVLLLYICLVIIGVSLFKGQVMKSFNVSSADVIENLSIPAQQISYTIKEKGKISEEEKRMLDKIVDTDTIPQVYESWISDPVKDLVRQTDNQEYLSDHWKEYLKLYINIGLKNPYDYINAWVNQTKGYYYHQVRYSIIEPQVCDNAWGIEEKNLFPLWVKSFLDNIRACYMRIYNELLSIGLFTDIFILVIMFIIKIRSKKRIAFLPVATIMLTLLVATPVYAEFRYAYPMYICLPFLFMLLFIEKLEGECIEG